MENKFIELDNKLFNVKYIKEVQCNDNYCVMTIANTYTGRSDYPFRDATYHYNKDTLPVCYNTLRELFKKK